MIKCSSMATTLQGSSYKASLSEREGCCHSNYSWLAVDVSGAWPQCYKQLQG